MARYIKIEKVLFDDGVVSYFLSNDTYDEFDVDLCSDLWFNEYKEERLKRKFIKNVTSLSGVLNFMKEKNIPYEKHFINGVLKVGGEHDMNLYRDLTFSWG